MTQDDKPTNKPLSYSQMLKYGIIPVAAFGGAMPAFAIDVSGVVTKIEEAGTATDTVGLALIGVAAGMLVIGLIVGMLLRRS